MEFVVNLKIAQPVYVYLKASTTKLIDPYMKGRVAVMNSTRKFNLSLKHDSQDNFGL